ncbi:sugar ABC transporter substrate-binding protein [Rhizobium sp. Root1203]|uniref:substrate-binding domain-containing protein n=1 Tax=Rhizobium sp. Root1203 TaxID=1736427 RepID=UPI00070AD42C|nr:substrate-binding domain-containing protein [Rhizobium sp. Root1203]KQV15291.1 sugar ABC transporter substrate-binding protein [Rhizobium sp. Root1203]
MLRRTVVLSMLAMSISMPAAMADPIGDAKAFVEKFATKVEKWDGPTTGPAAKADQSIVIVAGDLRNGGVLGAVEGMKAAADGIGWKIRVLDGQGSVSGRAAAMSQALATSPNGIIIAGVDSVEQKQSVEAANKAGIPIVSWHASSKVGPLKEDGIFANITTDAMQVADAAAYWAFADAKGKPGVVIFTDSTYQMAIAKADRLKKVIEDLGGTVLEYVDTPMADTSTRMPQLTSTLLQRYGTKWTHSLAVNDLYFDFIAPSLSSAGLGGTDAPVNVSAGDGSESAYQRIRAKQYQTVTVAEPLTLQGWQAIDEMNRALSGQEWSGYVAPLHVVTTANIEFDGGPKNSFDPENGYREEYMKVWGRK